MCLLRWCSSIPRLVPYKNTDFRQAEKYWKITMSKLIWSQEEHLRQMIRQNCHCRREAETVDWLTARLTEKGKMRGRRRGGRVSWGVIFCAACATGFIRHSNEASRMNDRHYHYQHAASSSSTAVSLLLLAVIIIVIITFQMQNPKRLPLAPSSPLPPSARSRWSSCCVNPVSSKKRLAWAAQLGLSRLVSSRLVFSRLI